MAIKIKFMYMISAFFIILSTRFIYSWMNVLNIMFLKCLKLKVLMTMCNIKIKSMFISWSFLFLMTATSVKNMMLSHDILKSLMKIFIQKGTNFNNKCMQRSLVLLFSAVFIILLLPQTAIAASYYVSPSGNDANSGLTTSAAWKSPSYAASKAVAGDTIYIMDGTWYDQHVVFKSKGTSSSPITMKAYNGTPVLDGVDKTGFGIKIYSSSWINVEGITVKNYQYGYWVSSSDNLTITRCEFSDTALDGITMWNDVKYFTIDSVIVKNTGDHGIHLWNQNSPGRSQYITVKNSTISNAPHNLLDVHTNVTNVVVENNELFFSNDYAGTIQVGLYLHNGNTDNILIRNNYFHDQIRPLEIFNAKNVQVVQNTFKNINGRAIFLASVSGYDDELRVYDSTFSENTFDNVNYAFGFWAAGTKYINLDIRDNIYRNIKNTNYIRTDAYYYALSGNSGFPQILNSKDTYYSVIDIIESPVIIIDKNPVADAGQDHVINIGSSVSFDASASTDDNGISTYSWDFDATNGIQEDASGKIVSHEFNAIGQFTVTLTVTDTVGQKSTDTCIVTVNALSSPIDNGPISSGTGISFIPAARSLTANVGGSTVFSVDNEEFSMSKWYFNGTPVASGTTSYTQNWNSSGSFTIRFEGKTESGTLNRNWDVVVSGSEHSVISIVPSATVVAPGEPFSINVNIDPKQAVTGYQFNVHHNDLASLVSIKDAGLFSATGDLEHIFFSGINDVSMGMIRNIYAARLGSGGVSSPGGMITMNMLAGTSSGMLEMNISELIVSDMSSDPVPCDIISTSVLVDTAPVFNIIPSISVEEGNTLTFTVSASDADGDMLSYAAESLPWEAVFDTSSGVFSWTPAIGQTGTYSSKFLVSDGYLNDTTSVNITVFPQDLAPVISLFEPATGLVFEEGQIIGIRVLADDPEGKPLTYSLEINGEHVSNSSGYMWTTDYSSAGTHSIKVTVCDGVKQVTQTHTISITDVHPRWDVNEDGKVNILDISLIGRNYGKTYDGKSPRWDVNQDGVVNIQDMSIVAARFGEIVV